MDGFFVAKFKKIGPTPPNAVGVANAAPRGKATANGTADEEFVDKTPIVEDEEKEDSDFGGWDEEEDQKLIERAQRSELRRKGKNPKAVLGAKAAKAVKAASTEKKAEENGEEKEAVKEKKDKKDKKNDAGAKTEPQATNGASVKSKDAESKSRRKSGGKKEKSK